MTSKLRLLLNAFALPLLRPVPGPVGRRLRALYYRRRLRHCGRHVAIDENVMIDNPEWVSIGDHVWIDRGCTLIAGPIEKGAELATKRRNPQFDGVAGQLTIGNNVHVGPGCVLQAHGGVSIGSDSALAAGVKVYSLSNLPVDPRDPSAVIQFSPLAEKCAYLSGPVVLGKNVGVASNSMILPGVSIGRDSFVSPFSLVATSHGDNSYLEGIPAVRTRQRFAGSNSADTTTASRSLDRRSACAESARAALGTEDDPGGA